MAVSWILSRPRSLFRRAAWLCCHEPWKVIQNLYTPAPYCGQRCRGSSTRQPLFNSFHRSPTGKNTLCIRRAVRHVARTARERSFRRQLNTGRGSPWVEHLTKSRSPDSCRLWPLVQPFMLSPVHLTGSQIHRFLAVHRLMVAAIVSENVEEQILPPPSRRLWLPYLEQILQARMVYRLFLRCCWLRWFS